MINLGNGIIRNTRSPGYRLVGKGVKKVSNALTSPAAYSKLNKKGYSFSVSCIQPAYLQETIRECSTRKGYSRTPLYGHPLNMDTSILQTFPLSLKKASPHIFSKLNSLNMDTPFIRTLFMASSVSIITGFDCTFFSGWQYIKGCQFHELKNRKGQEKLHINYLGIIEERVT